MIEQDTKVILNKQVASETYLMVLESPEAVAEAKPGQFVMIRVQSGLDPLLRRPFSVCGTRGDDQYSILYRVVGKGTTKLSAVREGEKLSTLGPLGRGFEVPGPGCEPVLVAGGIGVAPLIFLAQAMEHAEVILMTGYHSVAELIPLGEFGLLSSMVSASTDDGSFGYHGPVTELLERHLAGTAKRNPSIFACGPLPMLQRVAVLSLEKDISCQVSLEANMACGVGACQGCAVKASPQENQTYFHVCQDGPVFRVQSLDWKELERPLIGNKE
jgi:dihydroorotate dehydrogenase electron transfer subunit